MRLKSKFKLLSKKSVLDQLLSLLLIDSLLLGTVTRSLFLSMVLLLKQDLTMSSSKSQMVITELSGRSRVNNRQECNKKPKRRREKLKNMRRLLRKERRDTHLLNRDEIIKKVGRENGLQRTYVFIHFINFTIFQKRNYLSNLNGI